MMSTILDPQLMAELLRSTISWQNAVVAAVLVGLTLTGITARFLTWLGSVRP